jgi:ABC-2 type transport system ATP-binding protein
MITTSALCKTYGRVDVLDRVDLTVPTGTVFALLGPNGAGKTTTVRILSTLVTPDGGEARVAGFDVVRERPQVRRRISLTGQFAALDDLQTGAENLRMMGRLAGLCGAELTRTVADLVERFDLGETASRRVGTYSGGQRRRLDLAASLVGAPAVVFLDEPTTGLDPRSRQQTWQIVAEVVAQGTTVFLTTQYLEEAERLADTLAVLDAGRVVARGTSAELKQRYAEQRLDLTLADSATYAALAELLGDRTVHCDPTQRVLGLPTDGTAAHIRHLLDEVDPQRRAVTRFAVHAATLDDVFLALTGHATTKEPVHA